MDLRQRVMDAATQSFAMFGYKGTTIEQVARLANVGKGTMYTFFASKEALFTEILNELIADLQRIAQAAIVESRPFFENLERALHGILSYRSQHQLFVKLAQEGRELGTTVVIDGIARVEQAVVDFMASHIRQGQSDGNLVACNPEVVAFILLRTYTSLVTDWGLRRTPLSDEEIRQTFHVVFACGLELSQTN